MHLRRLFYIAGSLGLLGGIVTFAPPASATFSGSNGKVAFTKEGNDGPSIWSMKLQLHGVFVKLTDSELLEANWQAK